MTFRNQRRVYLSLRAVTTHANAHQGLRGYWTQVYRICAVVIFSSTVLTQQSALRSVHLLSNKRGDIWKRKSLAKHKPAGIAMPGRQHWRPSVVDVADDAAAGDTNYCAQRHRTYTRRCAQETDISYVLRRIRTFDSCLLSSVLDTTSSTLHNTYTDHAPLHQQLTAVTTQNFCCSSRHNCNIVYPSVVVLSIANTYRNISAYMFLSELYNCIIYKG